VVRVALHNRINGRAGGRAALFCACAIAALVAPPVRAAPPLGPESIGDIGTRVERGLPRTRSDLSSAMESDLSPPLRSSPSPVTSPDVGLAAGSPDVRNSSAQRSPGTVTANSGAFDIQVDLSEPRTFARIEQLLVTREAIPQANRARLEDGEVVLTSSEMPNDATADVRHNASAIAAADSRTEYAGVTLGCFGAGCTPAASTCRCRAPS